MGLETGTTIASLNASWPLGTDPKSQGDDHLRLIKSVIRTDALSKAAGGTVAAPFSVLTSGAGVSVVSSDSGARASIAPRVSGDSDYRWGRELSFTAADDRWTVEGGLITTGGGVTATMPADASLVAYYDAGNFVRHYADLSAISGPQTYIKGTWAAATNTVVFHEWGSATRYKVLASGDVQNYNNAYGAISDARLKENVEDAGSQWDDVKAIRFRHFNMIGDGTRQLGVIAQELQAAGMGGLVTEGDDGTLAVKYSVLLLKCAVALQEAIARIEALESR